jgi:hypothetical protein
MIISAKIKFIIINIVVDFISLCGGRLEIAKEVTKNQVQYRTAPNLNPFVEHFNFNPNSQF